MGETTSGNSTIRYTCQNENCSVLQSRSIAMVSGKLTKVRGFKYQARHWVH